MLANLVLSPLLVVIMEFTWPMAIDLALIVIFVGHAIALLLLGRKGPDGLDEAQFASVTSAHRALIIAAIALCVSALFDLLVFSISNGRMGRMLQRWSAMPIFSACC